MEPLINVLIVYRSSRKIIRQGSSVTRKYLGKKAQCSEEPHSEKEKQQDTAVTSNLGYTVKSPRILEKITGARILPLNILTELGATWVILGIF